MSKSKKKVGKTKIGNKRFDIVKLGQTFKHELGVEERDRMVREIKQDVEGPVTLSKPHTGSRGIHVDFINESGQPVGKLGKEDLISTTSESISGSATVILPFPQGAKNHTVGVVGTAPSGTVNTLVESEALKIHASSVGSIQVAFW